MRERDVLSLLLAAAVVAACSRSNQPDQVPSLPPAVQTAEALIPQDPTTGLGVDYETGSWSSLSVPADRRVHSIPINSSTTSRPIGLVSAAVINYPEGYVAFHFGWDPAKVKTFQASKLGLSKAVYLRDVSDLLTPSAPVEQPDSTAARLSSDSFAKFQGDRLDPKSNSILLRKKQAGEKEQVVVFDLGFNEYEGKFSPPAVLKVKLSLPSSNIFT